MAWVAVGVLLGTGCQGGGTTPEPVPNEPAIGSTSEGVWTWDDVPESTCDQGTPTGLAMNLQASKNLVIYFMGGGACWDAATCVDGASSTHGPFTQTNFNQLIRGLGTGSLFSRQLAGNPYKDWNQFFLPYCTGDLHIGNAEQVYTSRNGVAVTFRHKGRANAEAFLARIAATVPEPEQVLVTGSSAGGFGAVLNYTLVRSRFPRARVFLLDDAGPMLKSGAISASLRATWAKAWKYDAVLDSIDPAVKDDFSAIHPALARKYPEDRMALLSSLQDQVIRGYVGLSAPQFQTAVLDLSTSVLDPLPHTRSFLIPGETHTLLGNLPGYSSQGVTLLEWLQQMQTADDATWKTRRP